MSLTIQTGNVVKIQSGNRVLISAPGPQGAQGPAGSGVTDGDKGDITVTSSGAVWTIDHQAVTFAKMQHISTAHLLGRHSSGAGDVQQIGIDGGLELQGANLRRSALTGDVTASAGSNSTTIANDAVTYAKMQNVSAASVLLGRGSASGAGDAQEISLGTGLAINATTLSVSNIAASQITGILPSDQLQSGRALATISEIVASDSGETGVNQTWRNEQRSGYGTGERLTWFSANGAYVLNWVSTTSTWYLAVFNGADLWTSEDDVDYPWQITNWTTDTGIDPPPTFTKAVFADFVRSNGNGSALTNLNANNISSGTLGVPRGGTGATTLTANAVLLGNGTTALQTVAPGTTGNVLTSDGTTWTSTAPAIGSITGLGTGVATFLGTPTSANLRAALTDEVGTGAVYFVGGALGTPASGTVTNLTGTASININGTVGATTPTTGAFTTVSVNGGSVAGINSIATTRSASNYVSVRTTGSGGTDSAGISCENPTSSGLLFKAGTSYTTYKNISAGDLGFYNSVAGNISILNDFSSGNISLAAGGSSTPHLTIGSTGDIRLPKTITAAGTTGARTINQTSGSVNFAAAATSLVVTNSLVTANSVIICTVATNDATLKSVAAVAAAGSFTLHANAAATAETRVNFLITN